MRTASVRWLARHSVVCQEAMKSDKFWESSKFSTVENFKVSVYYQGSKFIFGLIGSTCANRCKFHGARWTPSPRGTCFKGSVHSHLSAESYQQSLEMEWKQCGPSSEKPQGETTNKTHTYSRKFMQLYCLKPECVIPTIEFIIFSFRFMSNLSIKYISVVR